MHERMKAMNPNFKKGGKVAHKVMGGGMPMGAQQAPMGAQQAPMGGAPMAPMANPALAQMSPQQRAQRAMMVRKALTGMKKGGMCEEKDIKRLEKELQHHEKLDMKHAHPMKKASGGAIDKDETKTTIKGNAKKFEKTKVNDGEHHDKHHGTGDIKDGKPAGYKRGGHLKHKFATGGAIPADTHESKNKGKTKFGGTIEDNEGSYLETEMHSAKRDKAHGTGGIKESNAGGFKHGGHAHKMHHKATGGAIPSATNKKMREDHLKGDTYEGGDWEDRSADTAMTGKKNGKTGQVNESNAGGYKHGGHASKKAYATGGNVVDDGKAIKMPKHFISRPVANSLQSGTFAKGGKVEKEEKPNLRLLKTHTGPKGHVAKVYKDKDWGEHRVKFFSPEGKHHAEGDYHTDDLSDAHDTAIGQLNRYKKGGRSHFADGGTEDLSNGAYDAHYENEKKENEAMRNAMLGAPRRAYDAVKSMFSSSKPPEGSVTKTEKSVTVAPPKKRGGSMRKC
jgi:hypothetical protein